MKTDIYRWVFRAISLVLLIVVLVSTLIGTHYLAYQHGFDKATLRGNIQFMQMYREMKNAEADALQALIKCETAKRKLCTI